MTNTENLRTVLAHHIEVVGISENAVNDSARDAGLVWACLGCGSVGGINPADGEAARIRTRDQFGDTSYWECCGDTVIF